MHYTSMINPLALLSCDSPASAKIIVDYVKTQLNVRLDNKLIVDADPQVPADGLPDSGTYCPVSCYWELRSDRRTSGCCGKIAHCHSQPLTNSG